MPIRFRCPHCEKLLGIARRKAGTPIQCPQCSKTVKVPQQDETPGGSLRDLDDLFQPPEPARSVSAPAPKPVTRPAPKFHPSADAPLFESENFDVLLGPSTRNGAFEPAEPRPSRTRPVSGADATSLDAEPDKITLSSRKATFLMVAAAALIVLAFAAGFLIRSNS